MIAAAAPRRISSVRSSARERRARCGGRRGCGRGDLTWVRGSSPSSKNDNVGLFFTSGATTARGCKFHIIPEGRAGTRREAAKARP
jgi:hypothetical protein